MKDASTCILKELGCVFLLTLGCGNNFFGTKKPLRKEATKLMPPHFNDEHSNKQGFLMLLYHNP
jgi:hypothetical protein